MNFLQQLLAKFKVESSEGALQEKEKPEPLLENVTFEGVANYIKKGQCEYNLYSRYFIHQKLLASQ